MDSINADLAAILQTVQTPGDFFAAGECAMHVPLIEVEGIGPIAFPLLPAQAARLIAVAERAPYGRGTETLVDTAVRRSWQIGADRVRIQGRHWQTTLDGVVERAAIGLGAGAGVQAELYKLLVYDEGSFFLEHRDTEKGPGMFGTLIVALPSLHGGGELVIRHREREARLDLRRSDLSELAWAAFYADCVHEVLPITSGCRLVLVYNLRRKGRGRLPRPPSYDKETVALERLLRVWCNEMAKPDEDQPLKLVYPLAHAYTPAELSFAALKGADAAAATVLTTAAGDAACELHLALLRIEESGAAEYNGYSGPRWRSRYHDDEEDDGDDENDDEFKVAEVFDRSLTLSEWRRPDGSVASLGALPFSDGEVCPPDALADMEPDEQHFREATGNEGASFERSYQRAALVLWPHAQRLRLIARAGLAASLPALDGMLGAWIDDGAEPGHAHWHEAHALAAEMLACWPVQAARRANDGPTAESAMLSQLVRLQDREHIVSMLTHIVAAGAYAADDNAALVQALKLLPASRVGALLPAIVQGNADLHIAGCADLLARAAAVSAWRRQLLGAAQALLDAIPGDPARPQSQVDAWRRERADAGVVHDTLRALAPTGHAGLSALADQAVTHWLAWPKTYGMDTVIVPALRRLAERPALLNRPACLRLRAAALDHLRARCSLDLAPPADWRREARSSCRCEHCLALGRFLQSADQEVWRFKAREAERRHVEDSIRQGRCDVDCSTERKGSPHVLVCTKNQASYERRVAQRRADLDDLTRLEA
ncbi:MAG: 2OG-Fe(II) oxygenase [Proteobacteria bacterium]|nr:2OG-Fe(II) oxygenase [Pseudomonadota bacterium]